MIEDDPDDAVEEIEESEWEDPLDPAEELQEQEERSLDPYDVLAFLVGGAYNRAVWTIEDLCVELGAEDLGPQLDELHGLGLISRWQRAEDGPSVMLSSYSAERQGFRMRGDSSSWMPRDGVESPPDERRPTLEVLERDLCAGMKGQPKDLLDHLPDRRAEPPTGALIRAELGEFFPFPVLLLGYWLPWPVEVKLGHCPGCSGFRERDRNRRNVAKETGQPPPSITPALCLICDWYTHEWRIPEDVRRRVSASKAGRGAASKSYRPSSALRGGIGA